VILAAGALAVLVLAVLTIRVVVPWRQHGRVVALVAEFKDNASPESADRLVDIMDAGISGDDADLVLLALLKPRVAGPVHARVGEPVDVPLECDEPRWSETLVVPRDPSKGELYVYFAENLLTIEDPSHPAEPLQSVAACSTRAWDPWDRFRVVFGLWPKAEVPRPRRTAEEAARQCILTKAGRYHGTVRMTFFWQKIMPEDENWLGAILWGSNSRGLDHACIAEFPVEIVVDDASRPSPETD